MQDLQTTIVLAVLLTFIATFIAGVSNKVVIYFDKKDLLISFMPWGSLVIGLLLLMAYQHEGTVTIENLTSVQTFIAYLSIASSVIFFIWSIRLSIRHNRSVMLGLLVGVFKILSALLGLLIICSLTVDINGRENKLKETVFAILFLGVFVWLGRRLINGQEVYRVKNLIF